MKNFIYSTILFVLTLSSCNNPVGENNPKVYSNGIMYFKDTTTNLCFGKVESIVYAQISTDVTSLTCVPCDSLKRIGIK